MKPLTILHTIETGGHGGAESVVLNLASRLDPSRFRSLALLEEDDWLRKKLEEQKIATFLVRSKGWYDLRMPRALIRLVREQAVDLIHAHLPGQNFNGCIAARWTNCKAVATYHGPIELREARGFQGEVKLWFVRHAAAAIVVVCDYVGRMLSDLGFHSGKIQRIYNGIDAPRFQNAGKGKLHRELGLADGTKIVGMVANVRQSKDYDSFIRAARQISESMPNTRFLAVGDVDPVLGPPLRELVKELSLGERFLFLGSREDVPDILSDLDVFVLASTSEGVPLVLLEAMAASKPVVATHCGGPTEIIEDGHTGFLVSARDPQSLASQVAKLLADPGLAAALGQRARSKVERDFSLTRMVCEYEHLYERLLHST